MAQIYRLICDDDASDRYFERWRATLVAGAEPLNATTYWRADYGFCIRAAIRPSNRKLEVWLSNDPTCQHWVVQVNAPSIAGDGNSLAAVGETEDGNLFILRQGRLHPNTTTKAQIKGGQFRHAFGMLGVPVKVCLGPRDREWFRVSHISNPTSTVSDTADFVKRCVVVRAKYG